MRRDSCVSLARTELPHPLAAAFPALRWSEVPTHLVLNADHLLLLARDRPSVAQKKRQPKTRSLVGLKLSLDGVSQTVGPCGRSRQVQARRTIWIGGALPLLYVGSRIDFILPARAVSSGCTVGVGETLKGVVGVVRSDPRGLER